MAERTSPVYNPATGEQTGSSTGHAAPGRRGRARAKVAWENEWRLDVDQAHADPLWFRDAQRAQDEIVRSSPPSTGVTPDALGEVMRGLEVVEFATGIPHLLGGG